MCVCVFGGGGGGLGDEVAWLECEVARVGGLWVVEDGFKDE